MGCGAFVNTYKCSNEDPRAFFVLSATWAERAEQDGGAADEDNRLPARPLHLQQ